MNVFAIIVIYNGMRNNWIQKCFDSVMNSSIDVAIIAIDNGSNDGSVEFIKQKYPRTELIISNENLGFGKANNVGLKKALDLHGEYFFLLNQDAWVDKYTIEKLILQSKKNPEYGVISPLHLNGKGDALDYSVAEFYIKPSKCQELVSDALLDKIKDDIYKIDFINAAAWLVTKDCLKFVGGFSPTFYHYGEDENYCHRVYFKKLKVGIYPKVNVCHDREFRPKILDKSLATYLKEIMISYSNPENKVNINRSALAYLKEAILNISNKDKAILNKNIGLALLKNKKIIIENKELSKTNSPNLFLN